MWHERANPSGSCSRAYVPSSRTGVRRLAILTELGLGLPYNDGGHTSREFQVFVCQSERVQWRLDHQPTDNDIPEGQKFVERGIAL